MLAKVNSAALYGIDALRVEVEIDLASGLPQLATVGLPEGAVKESKDRIRAAVKNCGYTFPAKRITINLAPADIKKEGSAYDLPMAVGILAAEGSIEKTLLDDYLVIGELSLDGTIKAVRGALSIAMAAKKEKVRGIILPEQNAPEAAVVKEVEVLGVRDLPQVVELLKALCMSNRPRLISTIYLISIRTTTRTSTTSKDSNTSSARSKSPRPAATT
jgi:magnesium chelatase family protein